uniref:G_PROTEIN_RECEP_F1_2 domain-containing protein n=1 Tax=Meloidogyne hapla TaxID=6305 RepID=A0A1I8BHU8_MELHA
MKKVYRSLFLIVFINIGGYIINLLIIMHIVIPLTINKPLNLLMFMTIPGAIINIASASNAIILCINSNDYKMAYKKELKIIKLILFKIFGIQQQKTTKVEIISIKPLFT